MTTFIHAALLIVIIITLVFNIFVFIIGIYAEIMGIADANKLLKKWRIPLNYKQIEIIGLICIVLCCAAFIIKLNI